MTQTATNEEEGSMLDRAQALDEPLRITVGNLKGGVGRSTSTMMLALALARRTGQRVGVVDADGANGTSFEWSEFAGEEWPSDVALMYWPSQMLAKRVREIWPDGHLIIDTGNDSVMLRQALMVTDHLLMPIAATPAEATRLTPTLTAAAEVAAVKPINLSILFTRTKPNTISFREAHEELKKMENEDLRVLDVSVPFQLLYSQAFGTVPANLGVYPDVLEEIIRGGGGR